MTEHFAGIGPLRWQKAGLDLMQGATLFCCYMLDSASGKQDSDKLATLL